MKFTLFHFIMATHQRNGEKLEEMEEKTEHVDSLHNILVKLQSLTLDTAETGVLWSRIDEQSSLICMLKQRADEQLLQCQALQKLNTELEGRETQSQTELESERKRADLLERRFMDIAANNQAIISFMDELKTLNAQLRVENKHLQSENDRLFSQKLHDKDVFIQKLEQEIKQLTEQCANQESEYREKLSEYKSKLLEQVNQQEAKERSLLDQLSDTKQQQRDAVKLWKDLEQKLQTCEEEQALKEINMRESIRSLTKEKDTLLHLSMERGKIIQEKQEEIQQLQVKCKEEKKARTKAEDRFKQEVESVNADVKVKSLQAALDESNAKYGKFKKEFEAFREHSTSLLKQERELNKKLRHMMG